MSMPSPKMRYALTIAAVMAPGAWATEPLHDQLVYDGSKGYIFPAKKCCWLGLPASEVLTAMRREENCSAIGGPVGVYRYQNDKLWLVGLYKCSGTVPLEKVFPNLKSPAVAEWLSGDYSARLDWICVGENGFSGIFARELSLKVEKGAVVSMSEQRYDKSRCRGKD